MQAGLLPAYGAGNSTKSILTLVSWAIKEKLSLWCQKASTMKDKIAQIKQRHDQVEKLLSEAAVTRDKKRYAALSKEYKGLSTLMKIILDYDKNKKDYEQNSTLFASEKSPEMLQLVKEERTELQQERAAITQILKRMLLPNDPNDRKNIILEIRQGSGGKEAAIWAKDLFRMYQRFAEKEGWTIEVISFTESLPNGYKEIIANVTGNNVYGLLKYECGVHRVQRVPATETQGRLHTSAASVVILPEVDEVAIHIDMNNVKKETFCSSGPGGQSVNTTYSAVRLTHLPTGITVSCQDGKSQIKNLEKALKVLRARLYERATKAQQDKIGQNRKSIISTGDRSAKIRTYNYARATISDHRINHTQHNLTSVLDGHLDGMIEALQFADDTAQLAQNQAA